MWSILIGMLSIEIIMHADFIVKGKQFEITFTYGFRAMIAAFGACAH